MRIGTTKTQPAKIISGLLSAAIFASAAMLPGVARAAITETSTVTSSYSFSFDSMIYSDSFTDSVNRSIRMGYDDNGALSEVGVDLTANLHNGSFDFLHDAYCVGKCQVSITTDIVFTLKNIGGETERPRFDSLVTPGHMAEAKVDGSGFGSFDFYVQQRTDPAVNPNNFLYSAFGDTGNFAVTSFNGLDYQENGTLFRLNDWSATNLNVLLDPIPAGETQYLVYHSVLTIGSLGSAAGCTDLTDCHGIQVAFGDPRNGGGGSTLTSNLRGLPQLAGDPAEPVIGRAFGAYETPARFVNPRLVPLPDAPDVFPPVTYGPLFRSQVALPEPASWAMMIGGFAAIGCAARMRRRPAKPTAWTLP